MQKSTYFLALVFAQFLIQGTARGKLVDIAPNPREQFHPDARSGPRKAPGPVKPQITPKKKERTTTNPVLPETDAPLDPQQFPFDIIAATKSLTDSAEQAMSVQPRDYQKDLMRLSGELRTSPYNRQNILAQVNYIGIDLITKAMTRERMTLAQALEKVKTILGQAGFTESDVEGIIHDLEYYVNRPEFKRATAPSAVSYKSLPELPSGVEQWPPDIKSFVKFGLLSTDLNWLDGKFTSILGVTYTLLHQSSSANILELLGLANGKGFEAALRARLNALEPTTTQTQLSVLQFDQATRHVHSLKGKKVILYLCNSTRFCELDPNVTPEMLVLSCCCGVRQSLIPGDSILHVLGKTYPDANHNPDQCMIVRDCHVIKNWENRQFTLAAVPTRVDVLIGPDRRDQIEQTLYRLLAMGAVEKEEVVWLVLRAAEQNTYASIIQSLLQRPPLLNLFKYVMVSYV
ncbi:MAG: hypothetical protein LBF65_00480 [Holosporales bacterium]|jgi:hypothetical protein|nr:hypothetical protein [Holosporales bacterium]